MVLFSQETGHDISQQVFHGCGRPQLGQRRRRRSINPKFLISEVKYFDDINTNNLDTSAATDEDSDNFSFVDDDDDIEHNDSPASEDKSTDYDSSAGVPLKSLNRIRRNTAAQAPPAGNNNNRELKFETLQFDSISDEESSIEGTGSNKGRRKNKQNGGGSSKSKSGDDSDDNKEPVFDKLVKDIRQKVKDTKKFWYNLPYQICNNEEFAASPNSDANCWNGNTIDR